jgi:hypothetical protein
MACASLRPSGMATGFTPSNFSRWSAPRTSLSYADQATAHVNAGRSTSHRRQTAREGSRQSSGSRSSPQTGHSGRVCGWMAAIQSAQRGAELKCRSGPLQSRHGAGKIADVMSLIGCRIHCESDALLRRTRTTARQAEVCCGGRLPSRCVRTSSKTLLKAHLTADQKSTSMYAAVFAD